MYFKKIFDTVVNHLLEAQFSRLLLKLQIKKLNTVSS